MKRDVVKRSTLAILIIAMLASFILSGLLFLNVKADVIRQELNVVEIVSTVNDAPGINASDANFYSTKIHFKYADGNWANIVPYGDVNNVPHQDLDSDTYASRKAALMNMASHIEINGKVVSETWSGNKVDINIWSNQIHIYSPKSGTGDGYLRNDGTDVIKILAGFETELHTDTATYPPHKVSNDVTFKIQDGAWVLSTEEEPEQPPVEIERQELNVVEIVSTDSDKPGINALDANFYSTKIHFKYADGTWANVVPYGDVNNVPHQDLDSDTYASRKAALMNMASHIEINGKVVSETWSGNKVDLNIWSNQIHIYSPKSGTGDGYLRNDGTDVIKILAGFETELHTDTATYPPHKVSNDVTFKIQDGAWALSTEEEPEQPPIDVDREELNVVEIVSTDSDKPGINATGDFFSTKIHFKYADGTWANIIPNGDVNNVSIQDLNSADYASRKYALMNMASHIEINGKVVSETWSGNKVDLNIWSNQIHIYSPKSSAGEPGYLRNDGTDVIKILAGFETELHTDTTTYPPHEVSSDIMFKHKNGAWAVYVAQDPVAAAVTFDKAFVVNISNGVVQLRLLAETAPGVAAQLGTEEAIHAYSTISENLKINGVTIKSINETTANAIKIDFMSNYMYIDVQKSILNNDGTDTVEMTDSFAHNGITVQKSYEWTLNTEYLYLLTGNEVEIKVSSIDQLVDENSFLPNWPRNYHFGIMFDSNLSDTQITNVTINEANYPILGALFDHVLFNGVSWRTIMSMPTTGGANYNIDANIWANSTELDFYYAQTNADYVFKFDNTDTLVILPGLMMPNGAVIKERLEFVFRGDAATGVWVERKEAAPATITVEYGIGSVKQDTYDFNFKVSANVGMENGVQVYETINENIIINGSSVADWNTQANNSIIVDFVGEYIMISILKSSNVLKYDGTDTIVFENDMTHGVITMEENYSYQATLSSAVNVWYTGTKPTPSGETVSVYEIKGFHTAGVDTKFTIFFDKSITGSLLQNFDSIYTRYEWLLGADKTYYSVEIINDLLLNGSVDSAWTKILIKEGDGEFKTLKEIYDSNPDAFPGYVMIHIAQGYPGEVATEAISICGRFFKTETDYQVKVLSGFVTPNGAVTDKDYLYNYTGANDYWYPDASLIKRSSTNVNAISPISEGDGYYEFFIKFGKTADYVETLDAITDEYVLNYIKFNGKTLKDILDNGVDANGNKVTDAIKASYVFQEVGNKNIVLKLFINMELSSEWGVKFDGKDYLQIQKDFETPGKLYLNKYVSAGFDEESVSYESTGWTMESSSAEISADEFFGAKQPPVVNPGESNKGGCTSSYNVTSSIVLAIIIIAVGVVVLKKKKV